MDTITTPKNTIKPLLPQTINIKSLYTYQSYLIKRPKHALTLKISRYGILLGRGGQEAQIKSELILQKSLSHLKSVRKVNLSGFQVKSENLNKNRFPSCFKHNSIYKISTLYWTRHQFYNHLGSNFAEKPLRYLPKLHSLNYELTSQGMIQRDSRKNPYKKDPLRYLKSCPKFESLQIGVSGSDYDFSKIFSGFQRYSSSLKHLALKLSQKNGEEGFVLPLENMLKLESACLNFVQNSLIWKIDGLSDLPKLQEISFEFPMNIPPGIDVLLRRLAERKIMKKVRLIFPTIELTGKEILEALQDFGQLTHFELNISIEIDDFLKIISVCLENMKQLQDLKLTINKSFQYESFDNFKEICQKIANLQYLRHLHLYFFPLLTFAEIPNFILFCGPIHQLETLSLTYAQANSIQSLLALKTSSSSLRKLKISFHSFSPDQSSQKLILGFILSLPEIQSLEIIDLNVEDDNFLYQIVRVVYSLKNLREFTIGQIKGQVTPSMYENALQAILSKRGLERFECKTSESLLESCELLVSLSGKPSDYRIDMEIAEMKNPFLESLKISDDPFAMKRLGEIICWP